MKAWPSIVNFVCPINQTFYETYVVKTRCKTSVIKKQTRIDEHVKKDKKPHVFQHLHNKEECLSSFDLNCLSILALAKTKYQTKLKKGMYIDWEKPNLNK